MPPVTGSFIWLKADTEVYEEVAASTLATDDGDTVGYWKDQSGNNRHFTANADDTSRPILKTNIVNSLPVVRADGSNDYLKTVSSQTLGDFTIHYVFIPREAHADVRVLYQYDGSDGWFTDNDTAGTFQHINTTKAINAAFTLDTPTIVTIQRGSGAMKLRINGVEVGTDTITVPSTAAIIYMFAALTPANWSQVDMAELLIYSSELSGTDIDTNESYLATRFDIDLETDGTRIGWYKADTGTFQNIDGTTAVTADGSSVGYWQDQSGKGNHLKAAANDTTRPTLKTNIVNSLPVIRFDGTNDSLKTISEMWVDKTAIIMLVIPKEFSDSVVAGRRYRSVYQYDGTNGWFCGSSLNEAMVEINGSTTIEGAVDTNMPQILTFMRDGSAITTRRNGEQVDTAAITSAVTIDEIFLGSSRDPSQWHEMDVAELIIHRGVDTTTIAADESYLATRFGLDLVTLSWESRAAMPAAKEQHGFEAHSDGLLYACAGVTTGGTDTNTIYSYNPATNTWNSGLTAMSLTGRQSGVFRSVGSDLYYIGGHVASGAYYDDVAIYSSSGDSWSSGAVMPTAREDMGSAVYDGKIFVYGGLIDATPDVEVATMEVYNVSANTWDETKADLPVAKWSGDFGAEAGNYLYAVGSSNDFSDYPTTIYPVATVYKYDPGADSWSSVANIPSAPMYKEVASDGTNLYVVSGVVLEVDRYYSKSVLRYNPTADKWTYVCKAPADVRGSGLAYYNGYLYMSGGYDGSAYTNTLYRLDVSSFAPAASTARSFSVVIA